MHDQVRRRTDPSAISASSVVNSFECSRPNGKCRLDFGTHAASRLHPHATPLCDSVEVSSNGYCRAAHRMAVMRILLPLWKEIPHPGRHLASFRQLFHMRWVQACRDQPRGVELVENVFLRALRLGCEVNHGTMAAVETVFTTRYRTIDCDLGV